MGDPPRGSDNVIRVAFGRRDEPETAISPSAAVNSTAVPVAYSRSEVARILAVSASRLRAWERAGLLRPSAGEAHARAYSFRDLVTARATKALIDRGVPAARIRRTLESFRDVTGDDASPTELRVLEDGREVVIRADGATLDPETGQLFLEFDLRDEEHIVRELRPVEPRSAYDFYLEGCRLDGEEATRARAEAAYRTAIERDPGLASAYTNLGTLRLLAGDRDEAERLFHDAMKADPGQSEAPYNLGFLRLEDRRYVDAIELLSRATEIDTDFADAHFNLAVALEESGHRTDATSHWLTYLALEPEGPYAAIARKRVDEKL